MEYKKTLNLPRTDFPIRANLKKIEEELLAFWEEQGIYYKIQDKNKDKEKYILHECPTYPNGDIHLGHALNKVLKDIVVKYKSMSGFSSPFVPGWDCHGLPIETQLIKEIGDKRKDMGITEFREKCREYALKYVDLHRREFKRLGVFADWKAPYLTLNPSYEEKIVELFGILAEKGYIHRGLKPIHWCPNCETALAEAEIEYEDERSPSIFVKFKLADPKALKLDPHSPLTTAIKDPKLNICFVIWTTTPWTLPANVAVAAHPDLEYVFVKAGEDVFVVAEGLLEDFVKRMALVEHHIVHKTKGKHLEGLVLKHPFIERDVLLVLDKYVTLEQGTGLVHIAPGHGEEDYKVGLNYNLPIIMPVDEKGFFNATVPDFIIGKRYDEANKLITEKMMADNTLLKLEFTKHSYPHCWRCKKPVIFRATEQWFVSVDHKGMRQEALKAIGDTKWYPGWGETRIRGMVESRPDWCISRQRAWGVPIPVFYCKKCHKPQMTGIFNSAARRLVKELGTNGWFMKEAHEILPPGTICPDCKGIEFEKETDILDVWFESGSSHAAVLEHFPGHRWPADLYLEGSDQHRGWFQTSLLIAIGYKGRAPYNAVLTHGFTVDDKGKKMSKSLGNVVDPQSVVRDYGADILRLWVASTNFRNDMAASKNILDQVREAYSKIRNTCRFLIGNLYDYGENAAVDYSMLLEIDKWILVRLHRLIERTQKAYEDFDFHVIYHALYDFCVNDLSAYYLDMSKDRLYCEWHDSLKRRSAQTAMYEILVSLTKIMAPILSFTAEDILRFVPRPSSHIPSVFLTELPKVNSVYLDKKIEERWEKLLALRMEVYKQIEELRVKKQIAASIEAWVEVGIGGREWLKEVEELLPMVFIVSEFDLIEGDKIIVRRAAGIKCERCWMLSRDVTKIEKYPTLCARCAEAVESHGGVI